MAKAKIEVKEVRTRLFVIRIGRQKSRFLIGMLEMP